MEDDLNFKVNGRRPQSYGKWKTTLIWTYMEDDPNFNINGRQPQV